MKSIMIFKSLKTSNQEEELVSLINIKILRTLGALEGHIRIKFIN